MPNIEKSMKVCILTLLLLLSQISHGQEYKIDSLFRVFQNDITTEQLYNHGDVVFDHDTQENYYLLLMVSPVDSLVKYINNPKPAIRCYMYSGLVRKNANEKLVKEILDNHVNDTASYKSASNLWKVNEYMQLCLDHKTDKIIDFEERIKNAKQQSTKMFRGERHGLINKNDLLKADSLICDVENCKIISFTMTIQKDTNLFEEKSTDNHITTAMKENINRLEIGNKLWIEDIKVYAFDGTIRNLGSRSLKIIK